jgi:hypothetical protein
MNGTVNTAATQQTAIGGVDNNVHTQAGYVFLNDLNHDVAISLLA